MAKTLENIRDQVRSFLDEPIAADWTDAELNTLINQKYHEVYSSVINVYEEYATLKEATTSVVADQQEYNLPSDFLKMRRVEVYYDDDSDATPKRALPIPLDQVRRDLANENIGVKIIQNPLYYLRGDCIGLLPIPDETRSAGFRIWYYATVSDLSDNDSTIDLPYSDRDWMLIAYGATADALRFGQQEVGEADRFDEKYERGIKLMQESLEDRISEEYKGIVDVRNESLDFGEWG